MMPLGLTGMAITKLLGDPYGQSMLHSWSGGQLHRDQVEPTNRRVVKFAHSRGTAEQRIEEGKNAIRWAQLS